MNSIDLVSDDDDVFAPPSRPTSGSLGKRCMCVACGPVLKPHVCPHGAKLMRKPVPSLMKTTLVEDEEEEEEEEEAGVGGLAYPKDGNAFGFLEKLLSEHTQMQQDKDRAEQSQSVMQSALQQVQASDASSKAEVAKLKAEIASKDKQLKRRESKKPVPAPAVAVSSLKTAPKATLENMLKDCTALYSKKVTDAIKKHPPLPPAAPAPAPPPAPVAAPATVTLIVQKNQAQQYLTERTLACTNASGPHLEWHFDSTTPPSPHAPTWTKITEAAVQTELFKLGTAVLDAAGNCTHFTPTVGNSVNYTFNQHTYQVMVVNRLQPVAPPAPPPPPPQPKAEQWQDDVLFKGKFFKLTNQQIDTMLATVDFDQADAVIKGSQAIADLATMVSKAGQGFSYDVGQCELWVKPLWLKVWLTAAKTRKFNDARFLMHGMRSNEYHKLAGDMSGFDMNFSQDGRMRYGFYASASDHIASDYNGGMGKYPDGSFNVGLLWTKSSAQHGAYENYHLGSLRYLQGQTRHNDAYAVRDQLLWLPLGLAVAANVPDDDDDAS